MHTYKYIIFIVFFIISCEKNNSIVDIDGQAYISLCGSSELKGNTLSVLSFNRLNGTSLINCSQVIEELQPDIIGLQESYEMGIHIADRFNYCYSGNINESTAIFSKYPIEVISDIHCKIFLNEVVYINFFNVHLPAYPYQPYDIRDTLITTASQAIYQAEQARGIESSQLVSDLSFCSENMPIIVTGDFNEPSHLDWVLGAENPMSFYLQDDISQFVVDWPTSNKMQNAGLIDTYRNLYPNPISNPGYTWTPNISLGEVHDRIDFIYFNNSAFLDLGLVSIVGPDDASDVVINNYESDHRGVFAVFDIDLSDLNICEFCNSSNCCSNIGTDNCCCQP